jgi:hypothetical protein
MPFGEHLAGSRPGSGQPPWHQYHAVHSLQQPAPVVLLAAYRRRQWLQKRCRRWWRRWGRPCRCWTPRGRRCRRQPCRSTQRCMLRTRGAGRVTSRQVDKWMLARIRPHVLALGCRIRGRGGMHAAPHLLLLENSQHFTGLVTPLVADAIATFCSPPVPQATQLPAWASPP